MAVITLKPPKTRQPGPFPADRVCAEPACITRLHRYHEGDYCYQHERPESCQLREHRSDFRELFDGPTAA